MELLAVGNLDDAGSMADGRQSTVGDFDRGEVLVLQIQTVEDFLSSILALQNGKAEFEKRASLVRGLGGLGRCDLGHVPAGRYRFRGFAGCDG